MALSALIVAAGRGTRVGGDIPKQFRNVGGKPVLRWAVEALQRHPAVRSITVAVGDGQQDRAEQVLGGMERVNFVTGGAERADSVRAGLAVAGGDAILVHDAARPFCPPPVIDRLVQSLEFFEGAAPVLAVGDTLARTDGELRDAVDRTGLVRVQTPQAFRLAALRDAYQRWTGPSPTDETTVVRAAGMRVAAIEGDAALEKLTTPADFERAEAMLAARFVARTGMGYDVHRFDGEGPIMLGGLAIPHSRGLAGHSDADVVLHAITDALLGASGLGDIGEHFPPSDPQWKGAGSDLFLAHAASLISDLGGMIDHVDCTVICEEPKIGPHRSTMRERVAAILGLPISRVSIKATTTEGLGFTGRREGIAAQAVASIRMETE
ncbi:MAG TPA: bifunctional 2-C-methyl-D-erythritol 4-phosphate cytidylyltransferase/2-C-methyl-D-erythritol 2,4-cyclodiphosphate synthase [Sphingomicrobium sp.]